MIQGLQLAQLIRSISCKLRIFDMYISCQATGAESKKNGKLMRKVSWLWWNTVGEQPEKQSRSHPLFKNYLNFNKILNKGPLFKIVERSIFKNLLKFTYGTPFLNIGAVDI